MGLYYLEVQVTYKFEVEADSWEEAEEEGWNYSNYNGYDRVDSINVTDITPEPDTEEGEE